LIPHSIASIFMFLAVATISLVALIRNVRRDSDKAGYDRGFQEGYTLGWDEGGLAGRANGLREGRDKGYGEGSRDALEEASEQITKLLQDIGDEDEQSSGAQT
jgi:flagellar biosynthesis/type III secretory pathway protein FliH